MITLIDESGPWMKCRIIQDTYKKVKERLGPTAVITNHDFNLELAEISCTYSSLQWRMKAKEILEERLK